MLIEMLVGMVVIGIALGLATAALLGTFKIQQVETAHYLRLVREKDLADRFRQDVAGAVEAPADWDDWLAGPHCLILRNKGDRHVIYYWTNNCLERWEATEDTEAKHLLPLPESTPEVVFHKSGPHGRIVTLRLKRPQRHVPDVLEFFAALGGDWR